MRFYFHVTFSGLLLAFLLLQIGGVYAQPSLDSLNYSVGLKLSGSRISGTINRNAFVAGLETHLAGQNVVAHNSLSYRYSNFNGSKIEDNWYDLLTVLYYPNGQKYWYPAAFYHFDNNLLFRVNIRHRYGVGIGTIPIEKKSVFLRLAAGIAYETTLYNGEEFVNSDLDMARRQNGLFVFRLNNDYHLFKSRIILKVLAMYMQSLKEASDYDIWLIPSVVFRLNKSFSFFVNYDYRFEHVHLKEIAPTNDILVAGLTVSLSNQK